MKKECGSEMKKRNGRLRPFVRQFYRGNKGWLVLSLMYSVFSTAAALMISWLIQQIIDMTTGLDTGFTFGQIVALTVVGLLLEAAAWGIAIVSKPRFTTRAVGQYKEYVFEQICKKGISAFSAMALGNALHHFGRKFIPVYLGTVQ